MKIIKSEKGMTLIEIIISLSILGIVSVGIIGFFTDSFKFQARIQEISKAQKVADAIIEDIKNGVLNYDDGYEGEKEGYKFKIERTLLADNSGDGVVNGIELYDVTVTVSPKNNSSIVGTASSTIRKEQEVTRTEYTITYYYDSGSFVEDFYGPGNYNVHIYVPEKEGYTFNGWRISGDNTTRYGYDDYGDVKTIYVSGNITLEAAWN